MGALLAGGVADVLGPRAAIWTVGGITALSGIVVAVRMHETHPVRGAAPPRTPALSPGSHPSSVDAVTAVPGEQR